MHKPLINIDQLSFTDFGKGASFGAGRAEVSALIGASKLGYAVIRLQPGKRAWPYHAHYVNEEFFFILNGEGTLRHGGEEFALRKGDFICAPADPDQPHQIINTSRAELRYIALSTMEHTDVFLYPDSEKYGVRHRKTPNPREPGNFLAFGRKKDALDYWDGETDE